MQVIKQGTLPVFTINCHYCGAMVSYNRTEAVLKTNQRVVSNLIWLEVTCPACRKTIQDFENVTRYHEK